MSRTSYGTGKDRLLDAALRKCTSDGFDRTSIRAIGREAGLSNPALYRHFASKEELGIELYRRCYEHIVGVVEKAAGVHAKPLDSLTAYITAVTRLIETDLELVLYVDENQVRFWPSLRDSFEPRTLSGMVTRWIAAGRRDGSIDKTVPQTVQVALVMGTVAQWAAFRAAGMVKPAQSREVGKALRRALASAEKGDTV